MVRDWMRRLSDRRLIGAGAVTSALMGLAGPFGTYGSDDLVSRVLFWTLVIGLSLPIAVGCRVVVDRRLAGRGYWARALVVCAAFTLLYAPLLQAILHVRIGPGHSLWLDLPEIAAIVFAVALLVNVLDWVADLGLSQALSGPQLVPLRPDRPPSALPAGPAPAPPPPGGAVAALPRLVDRLPAALRGPVLSVSVRDHYVDVRTALGEHALLLRLSDAIKELDGVEGAQVHRSHWVARAAVAAVERGQGRVRLRLVDGRAVPVSRGRLADLSRMGWI